MLQKKFEETKQRMAAAKFCDGHLFLGCKARLSDLDCVNNIKKILLLREDLRQMKFNDCELFKGAMATCDYLVR